MPKLNYLFVTLAIIFALVGCTFEKYDTSGVNNKKTKSGDSVLAIKASAIIVDPNLMTRGDSGSIVIPSVPAEIKKVIITISGVNVPEPIEYNLVKIGDIWQGIIGNIPAGNAKVVGKAYDANDKLLYQSQVDVVVVNHQILNLNMNMQPLDPPLGYNIKAPRIDLVNISPKNVAPGDTVRLEVIAHDPTPGGPLTYIWTPQNAGSFSDRMSPNPIWTAPTEEGVYQLTITVIDQEFLVDHFTVSIDVNKKYGSGSIPITIGVNNFPVIYSIIADPTRIDKGQSTQLTVDAYDPDGNNITYKWSSSLNGVFDDLTSPNPTFTVDQNVDYGPCQLTVEVSDGSLTTKGSIVINISNNPTINTPPIVKSIFQSAKIVSANGVLTFITRAQDPEGSKVTFKWTCNAGTFSNQSDTLTSPDYQSQITYRAPASSTVPLEVTVEVIDESGLSTIVDFIPINMR